MKSMLAALCLFTLPCLSADARDLIIEKIIVEVPPMKGPYFAYVLVEAEKSKAEYHLKLAPLSGQGREFAVNLVLKDVPENRWCKITLHLDPKADDVNTFKAVEKHTARFQVKNSGREVFIPFQNPDHTWVWKIDYSTKN